MRELRYSDYYASYEELRYGTTGSMALQTVPEYEEEVRRKKKKSKKGQLRVVKEKKTKAWTNKVANVRTRFWVGVAFVAIVAIALSCYNYLLLKAQVSEKTDLLAKLESQYVDLKTENDLTEVVIDSTIDYDKILDVAINELGMVTAKQGQVITYESQEMECVKQLGNIPVK